MGGMSLYMKTYKQTQSRCSVVLLMPSQTSLMASVIINDTTTCKQQDQVQM